MDTILAVKGRNYVLPVGSLIHANGETVFYRNINDKHLLRKKGYSAIFMDEAVVEYLSTSETPTVVVYDYKGNETSGTYRTTFSNYQKAKTINMAGRKQRGVNIERFVLEPNRTYYARPTTTIVIEPEKI